MSPPLEHVRTVAPSVPHGKFGRVNSGPSFGHPGVPWLHLSSSHQGTLQGGLHPAYTALWGKVSFNPSKYPNIQICLPDLGSEVESQNTCTSDDLSLPIIPGLTYVPSLYLLSLWHGLPLYPVSVFPLPPIYSKTSRCCPQS